MADTLEAIIGLAAMLTAVTQGLPALVVPLRCGLGLVPMTDDLFDRLTDGGAAQPVGFWKFPGGFDRLVCAWSAAGPVAYVEADYFGGVGRQCAAVWSQGAAIFGPVTLDEAQPAPPAGTPISQALARLGIARHHHRDEFDVLGLGQHRHTEDWLP